MTILYSAFALFGLTVFCVVRLAKLRLTAIRRGDIDPRFFQQYRDYDEPEALRVASRHVSNLFEAPVLFYAIVLIAFVTQQVGWLPLALAWLYVLLRIVHSYVHLTTNDVRIRFRVFAVSWLILILLWAVVFLGIAFR